MIDAKNLSGEVRVTRPLFGRSKLLIAGRDRTKLIDGLDRQVSAVRDALASTGASNIEVKGVLCILGSDLPLLGTLEIRGHLLLHPTALAKRLNRGGPLPPSTVDALARLLHGAFPAA